MLSKLDLLVYLVFIRQAYGVQTDGNGSGHGSFDLIVKTQTPAFGYIPSQCLASASASLDTGSVGVK